LRAVLFNAVLFHTVLFHTVPIDEGQRLAAEGVGEVRGFLHVLGPTEDFAGASLIRDVDVQAAEEAEELVKTTPGRPQAGPRTQVPFANEAGRVTGRFEPLRERCFIPHEPESSLFDFAAARIKLMPKPLLIPPGHQAGPRRTANRAGNVTIHKTDA